LRDNGAYTVVKFAHLAEADQKVRARAHESHPTRTGIDIGSTPSAPRSQIKDQITRLVGLLQREEGDETKIEEVGGGDLDIKMEGEDDDSDDDVGVIEVL
jgi:hypothetical protein